VKIFTSANHVAYVTAELNDCPRKGLGYDTPAFRFATETAAKQPAEIASQVRSKCPHDTQVLHRLIESAAPPSGIPPVGSFGHLTDWVIQMPLTSETHNVLGQTAAFRISAAARSQIRETGMAQGLGRGQLPPRELRHPIRRLRYPLRGRAAARPSEP
jgi:hypothetical protein